MIDGETCGAHRKKNKPNNAKNFDRPARGSNKINPRLKNIFLFLYPLFTSIMFNLYVKLEANPALLLPHRTNIKFPFLKEKTYAKIGPPTRSK